MIRRALWRLLLEQGGFSRIWYGLATAMVIVGGGLIYNQATEPSAPAGTANLWVDTNGGTCTRSSSPASYSDAAACSSLDAAYSASGVACGDTILVKGGSYSNQQVNEVGGLSACNPDVTIAAADGETVTFDRLYAGDISSTESSATNAPDNVTFRGFTIPQGFATNGDGTDIVVDDMDGGAFYIGGGNGITIKNSDWGPCYSTGNPHCTVNDSRSAQIVIEGSATSNVTLEGNTIHDFLLTGALDHWECIRMDNAQTNLTMRGNHFYSCELYGSTSTGEGGTTTIENNWFGCTGQGLGGACDRGSSIVNIGDTSGTYIIRFNSFAPGEGIADEGSPTGSTTSRFIVGNILGVANCSDLTSRATVNYNVFFGTGGTTCGTNATSLGASAPYVDDSATSAGNYHLSGSDGSTGADNYVPTSATNSGAGTDYDGASRPVGTNRDAGADER